MNIILLSTSLVCIRGHLGRSEEERGEARHNADGIGSNIKGGVLLATGSDP